jgi:hypothetical protein
MFPRPRTLNETFFAALPVFSAVSDVNAEAAFSLSRVPDAKEHHWGKRKLKRDE